jgi:hypothetical protein
MDGGFMTRITHAACPCLIAIAAAGCLAACSGDTSDRTAATDDSARPAAGASAVGSSRPDKTAILASAKADYEYEDPARGPVPATDPTAIPNPGVPQTDAPNLTIRKARRKNIVVMPKEEVLALVYSDKRYSPLGIIADTNYIWRDRSDADSTKWKVYMVPDDATNDLKKLKRDKDKKEYSRDRDPTKPRLVTGGKKRAAFVVGVCLEDPACGTGHCGYGDVDSSP